MRPATSRAVPGLSCTMPRAPAWLTVARPRARLAVGGAPAPGDLARRARQQLHHAARAGMAHRRPVERAFLPDDAVRERPVAALRRRHRNHRIGGAYIIGAARVACTASHPDGEVGTADLLRELRRE